MVVKAESAVSLLLYTALVCGFASALLTLNPAIEPARRGFGARFVYCLWRYALPGWCMVEAALWLYRGRLYP